MVRHGSRPNKAATIRLPHRRPRRDLTPAGNAAAPLPAWLDDRDGLAPAARPARASLRPPPLPTTPTARPSSFADNDMSATEDQNSVGVRVPNTPLSLRRGWGDCAARGRHAPPVGCSGWFGGTTGDLLLCSATSRLSREPL